MAATTDREERGMAKDARIETAVRHWAHRMVTNGVPLADFEDVAGSVEQWKDWCAAWARRGAFHEGLGRTALAEGRTLSAGEHLTTAAACFHFGKFLFADFPDEMRAAHARAVACRTDALPYLRPAGERIEIPYDGITLKANLRKPEGIARPPVVVMAMGLDSAKEEMDSNERVFLDRGMATLAFDGPGQGEGEYARGICPEYEKPVGAVLDWIEGRDDLDAGRIGLWGVSMGGYYAPRAAAHDRRIRACVALTGPFDLAGIWDELPGLTREAFVARSQAGSAEAAYEVAKRMTLKHCAADIACPLHIVAGALDRVIPASHARRLAEAASGPVVMTHVADGGHVVNNRPYSYRPLTGDWMAAQLE
jgi:2,6-dihydroxypseudooxynicotine hydrolase